MSARVSSSTFVFIDFDIYAVILIARQRSTRCDRKDRRSSERNRPAEWAGKWRDTQSWAEVQQDAAAAFPATYRTHQQDTKLLGYSVRESPAGTRSS